MDPTFVGGRQDSRSISQSAATSPQTQAYQHRPSQPQNVITPDLPVDYRLLLLSLADHYIDQARSLAADVVSQRHGSKSEQYYKLMATGMGCLVVVLDKLRSGMSPRQEAMVRLRYSLLLFEETDNYYDMEMQLGKAIAFCDRFHLPDLKYSMQHLQCRIIFKQKPKAAFKYLDAVLNEAMTWNHTPWIYAFRFLRISFSLNLHSLPETIIAMKHVKSLCEEAKSRGDHSVLAMAAIMEAYIHLNSRDLESITEAHRAIATARAAMMSSPPTDQMGLLISMLELVCTLDPHDYQQSKEKMHNVEVLIARLQEQTGSTNAQSGLENGSFLVPLQHTQHGKLILDTGGIFVKDAAGRDNLTFCWYSRYDWYLLGFVLSTASVYPSQKPCMEYIGEVTKLEEEVEQHPGSMNESLAQATQRVTRRRVLKCHLLVYLVLVRLNRSEWSEASLVLREVLTLAASIGSDLPLHLTLVTHYLEAIVHQAIGALDAALRIYSSPLFALSPPTDRSITHVQTELSVLSAINRILIISSRPHRLHDHGAAILEALGPHFPSRSQPATLSSANQHLHSAYKFAATLLSENILNKKTSLQQAIQHAKAVNNLQLLTLTTTYLFAFMCQGILGEQNVNTVKGALKAARLAENRVWQCVATELLGEAFALEGDAAKAVQGREEARQLMGWLPGTLGVVSDAEMSG